MKKIKLNTEDIKSKRFQLVKERITALNNPDLIKVQGGYPTEGGCTAQTQMGTDTCGSVIPSSVLATCHAC